MKQIYSVAKILTLVSLKQVVHIATAWLKRANRAVYIGLTMIAVEA
jgi:hypothetical protein